MSGFIMEIELPGNCAAVLEGSRIKYWIGEGLPVFIGTLAEFREAYPTEFDKLVMAKVIKRMSEYEKIFADMFDGTMSKREFVEWATQLYDNAYKQGIRVGYNEGYDEGSCT